jgi:hypothetical protein
MQCPHRITYNIGQYQVLLVQLICLALVVCTTTTTALQISMMSSPSSGHDAFKKTLAQAASLLPPPPGADTISSNLISQLAIFAIKRRLKAERNVNCEVSFSSSDLLLNGRVGPVTISGKDWCSYRGLSCRAIKATVEQCELDAKMIISNRKLILTTPAIGKAIVALTANDFGNFITHPIMKTFTSAYNSGESTIEFLTEGVSIDPLTSTVIFVCMVQGSRWKASLQPSTETKKATVRVSPIGYGSLLEDQEISSLQLSKKLERFFNEMVFELDGTYLSYRDMMVTNKGDVPCVMIALNIKVKKLASPGMDF